MNVRAAGEAAAVTATAPFTLVFSDVPTTFVSLAVGFIGVWLARTVFVGRENRRLQRRQSFRETAPVTGIAMLIVGVIVTDRHLGNSGAAFVGLGVGWTTVLLLEIIGERAVRVIRTMLGADPLPPAAARADISGLDGEMTDRERDAPADMAKLVDRLDDISPDH